jgi:MFS family permease
MGPMDVRARVRAASPLERLGWAHGASAAGDGLVAVALAGTLFFAVPVAAARPRVALYLLVTVAPFAVVAPLLGRLLDGRRGAARVALAAALLLRALLAFLAVARIQSLLLYPLAFGLLVCSRAHGISRSALVPELAGPTAELVAVNGRMARVAAVGGTLGALLGVGLAKLLGGGAVLLAAALAFAAGALLAATVPAPWHRRRPPAAADRPERRRHPRLARLAPPPARVRLARTASAAARAAGGFALFLLAFALRRRGVSAAGLGLLLAGLGVGGVVGAFLLPRAGRLLKEEGLLGAALILSGFTLLALAGRVGLATAGLAGLLLGAAVAAARLGFDSLVQREVAPAARGTAITRAETAFQLAFVAGAVVPVALPLPTGPSLVAAGLACLAGAGAYLVALARLGRRRRPAAHAVAWRPTDGR